MLSNDPIIQEFNFIQKPHLKKDTARGISFIPEAPYDDYEHGFLYIKKSHNTYRRYVWLGRRKSDTQTTRFGRTHTFARYAFQVNLWKTKQQLIPEGLEVDHINDNAMDDRLDNYQLLTGEENLKKAILNKSVLVAVLVCPVCLNRFEKPASTTQYAAHNKPKKPIFYCCTRCHLTSEISMPTHEKYRPLRDWISDNQIYKLVRVWTDGRTKLEDIVSEKMLDFDLAKETGISVNYGSAKYASTSEKRVMIRDYRNQGLTIYQIAEKMQLHPSTIWELAGETKKSVDLKGEELHETLLRIKHWRNQGYGEERIGRLLGIPRTSISNYIRRHAGEYGISNDAPASKGNSVVTLICPVCKAAFERPIKLTQLHPSRAGRIMCCCEDCRWDLRVKLNRITDRGAMRKWISENQVIKVDKVIPSGVRFFDRDIPHDQQILTFDWTTFIPPSLSSE